MKRRPTCPKTVLLFWLLLAAVKVDAQEVKTIASGAGSWHNLFLKSGGSLWGMGYNPFGQLGDGTTNNINYPEQIVASNVTAIAGGKHTLFIKSDASLWAMGDNFSGQLGDGTYETSPFYGINRPEMIVASNVVAIAAGNNHSLFIKNDGSLWGMGANSSGELGNGTYYRTNIPQEIVPNGVSAIAAGGNYSLFIKTNGSLWAMGDNSYGQLGDGTFNSTNHPEQIVASNVTAMAAGYQHTLFIKSDGSLWGMGFNGQGQLGNGSYATNVPPGIPFPAQIATNVTAVAAGYGHTLFLKKDGGLWGMGSGEPLGDGTNNLTNRPEQILIKGVVAIAAGFEHSLFLRDDGSLWATGYNEYGQVGDGTTNSTNLPEQILGAFNQISGRLLGDNMTLAFVGIADANYTLDRSFGLSPPNWVPQMTNTANSIGSLNFTNTPGPGEINFWRIRSMR